MTNKGFTLIEVLVYIALYALIITGAVVSLYSVAQSGNRNQAIALVQEEGAYLINKIDWVLADAQSVLSPVAQGSILSVTRFDGSTVAIFLSGNTMRIREGTVVSKVLNNSNTAISSLVFIHTNPQGIGIHSERIDARFTIQVTSLHGHSFSRKHSTTKHVRKYYENKESA